MNEKGESFDFDFENDDYDSESEEFDFLFQKKAPLSLNIFVKDIEISKRDFLTLFLLLNSFLIILFLQLGLYQYLTIYTGKSYNVESYLFIGIVLGLVISIYLVDSIKKPLNWILYFLISVIIFTSIEAILIIAKSYSFILNFLFFMSGLLIMISAMLSFKVFLLKTSILERGRIWAYIFLLNIVILAVLFLTILLLGIVLISVVVLFICVIYIVKEIKTNNIILHSPIKMEEERENLGLNKYYLFFGALSFTAGLASPSERSLEIVIESYASIAFIFGLIILFTLLSALLSGIIFDNAGRIGALTYILLIIAIANYSNTFTNQLGIPDLPNAAVFSAQLAAFMAVPLLIGDVTSRSRYGKSLSISYIAFGIGLIAGLTLRNSIIAYISDKNFAYNLIVTTTFMACIVCFVFLVRMRETLPHKEQEWKKYLIHFYIIHESGMLLYQYAYERKDEGSHPDLVSGGIIGIISLLKEIVQGKKKVRSIDHEDRKLIFSQSGSVIFALVVKEESIVLRKKLEMVIDEFNKLYYEKVKEIDHSGLNVNEFKDLKFIIRKYFGL